uniref:DUF7287 family protein n=1 Tax=Methanothrix sp. TaxID=90426 RepID=UPI003BEECACA
MIQRMDDEGQLSIDFLIGFTIFMLGLIMVASMVPGLMVGLRRTTAIDYDAVAYRTGAILAEDPGWPVYPAWEKANNREAVERFGLAVDKETPNVLSKIKIDKFFGNDLGMTYPGDYRSRLIFSDYPYRLNVTLNVTVDSGYEPPLSIGDQKPELELEGYGYIRRVVKIKDEPWIRIDLNATHLDHYCLDNTTVGKEQNFTVRLDLRELLKRNISPAYQYNPLVEPINITIFNFQTKFNNTGNDTIGWFNNRSCNASIPEQWDSANLTPPDNATLKSVRFRIAGMQGEFDPDDFGWNYIFTVSNVSYTCS